MQKIFILFGISFLVTGCGADVIVNDIANNGQQEATNISDSKGSSFIVKSEPNTLNDDEYNLSLVGFGESGALSDKDLTIVDMLAYALQDEHLAHDEYELIMTEYGRIKPYSNIVNAELNHIDLLEQLYDIYSLSFPTLDTSDHLALPGSLLEAAKTGVIAEVNNIKMYEIFLDEELPENIKEVFEELMDGSEKHLDAFNKQVEKYE